MYDEAKLQQVVSDGEELKHFIRFLKILRDPDGIDNFSEYIKNLISSIIKSTSDVDSKLRILLHLFDFESGVRDVN